MPGCLPCHSTVAYLHPSQGLESREAIVDMFAFPPPFLCLNDDARGILVLMLLFCPHWETLLRRATGGQNHAHPFRYRLFLSLGGLSFFPFFESRSTVKTRATQTCVSPCSHCLTHLLANTCLYSESESQKSGGDQRVFGTESGSTRRVHGLTQV